MSSKAQRLKRKRARAQAKRAATMPEQRTATVGVSKASPTARPTQERRARGRWSMPQGAQKSLQPMVDLASDMIGRLYEEGKLNASQEQAARTFQELWSAYRDEIGASGYRSCLAGGVGAHDDSDGNPAVYAAWNGLCNKIGRVSVAALKLEVERGADEKPLSLDRLRAALNRVAGA